MKLFELLGMVGICLLSAKPLATSHGGLDLAVSTKAMHQLGQVDLSEESALIAASVFECPQSEGLRIISLKEQTVTHILSTFQGELNSIPS